jgi:hypothetical protein
MPSIAVRKLLLPCVRQIQVSVPFVCHPIEFGFFVHFLGVFFHFSILVSLLRASITLPAVEIVLPRWHAPRDEEPSASSVDSLVIERPELLPFGTPGQLLGFVCAERSPAPGIGSLANRPWIYGAASDRVGLVFQTSGLSHGKNLPY